MQKSEIQALFPNFEGAVTFAIRRVERRDRRRSKAENEGFLTAPVSALNSSNCERYGAFFKIQAVFDFDGYSLMNIIIIHQTPNPSWNPLPNNPPKIY